MTDSKTECTFSDCVLTHVKGRPRSILVGRSNQPVILNWLRVRPVDIVKSLQYVLGKEKM